MKQCADSSRPGSSKRGSSIATQSTEADKAALVAALGAVTSHPSFRRTLIPAYTPEEIGQVAEALGQCESFRRAADRIVFSGTRDILLTARGLADKLLFQAHVGGDPGRAADWLLRVLDTHTANGRFIAAIWGLEISEPIALSDNAKLVPFSELQSSSMTRRIVERGEKSPGWFVWWSDREWSVPTAAIVTELPTFPYSDAASARAALKELQIGARRVWTLIEIILARHPLVFGWWFEYEDEKLDLAPFDNFMVFSAPEVSPRLPRAQAAQAGHFPLMLKQFGALPADYQGLLLRSAERFTLSQCRNQRVDLILDLALAYEIAVSGKGEQGMSPTWKVSTRTAQLIGGELEERKKRRSAIRNFYRLRNEAAHGGRLDDADVRSAIDQAIQLYPDLFGALVSLGRRPDWPTIEIEPPEY